jgi:spiro-SPASM protein
MNIVVKEPSLLAIYLSQNQKKILGSNINESLLKSFTKRIKNVFPEILVYSNYIIPTLDTTTLSIESEKDFILEVSKLLPPSDSEDKDFDEIYIAYFNGIYPLLSTNSTKSLVDRHKKYISQYSYSENLPNGIVPILISREFISTLPDRLEISFHEYLLKNINNYDTEIYFESPDLRNLRLDFTLKDFRSINLSNNLLNNNNEIEYKDILPTLQKNPSFFRSSPSYIELELYRGCNLTCSFCPRTIISMERENTFFSKSEISNLIIDLNSFNDDFTICFGGMGEPLLHPDLVGIIDEVLNENNLKELIIETALYPNTDKLFTYLKMLPESKKSKIIIIVNLTTLKENRYKNLYGSNANDLNDILNKVSELRSTLNSKSIYVQMIKIKEIESEIEDYFNYFEKLDIQVLLQKYNSFASRMPEKRVSDLTPIKRDFCWHLARDLYIQSNGDVSACKQVEDIVLGNIKNQSLQEIWNQNSKRFSHSFNDEHGEIDLPCLKCDEWFTFNA